MDKANMNALAQKMVSAVKGHTARSHSAVIQRVAALETNMSEVAQRPAPSSDPEFLRAVAEKVRADIPEPTNGKDADMPALREAALVEVARLVDAIPKPKDGISIDEASIKRMLENSVRESVAALPMPRDGKDVDYTVVRGHVQEAVSQAMAALPPAKDGRDAAELDILPSIDEMKSYRRGTWASHEGGLLRASRQTDSLDGKTVTEAGWIVVTEGISAIVVTQGEDLRTIEVASMLTSGTKAVARFQLPVVLDRGVYRPDTPYEKGDGVTWGGSWWIAQIEQPTDKPGISAQWRLAVKQGERGKSAIEHGEHKRETAKLK